MRSALDAPTLARTAAVVRDRSHVTDRRDVEADRLQRAQRRFAARPRTLHVHLEGAHAVFLRLAAGILGSRLGGEGSGFARALEALRAGGRPGDCIALNVRDGNHGVVEGRTHVSDAGRNVLLFAAAQPTRLWLGHDLGTPYLVAFFLPAIGLAGPLRVRALVWVR